MNDAKLRAWWAHRQGLDGSLAKASPAQILERAGWARSVGGVGPYLTLFSRAGIGRAAADAAVAKLQIHELPSARGCTYVLPATDFALGLAVGGPVGGRDMNTAFRLGVTEKEIKKLCDSVLKALDGAQLDPDEIRIATGKASRGLGDEGKKKGLSTTLPLALGQLQARGDIRRVPVNGRLDQQRYKYTRWSPNPMAKYKPSRDASYTELARRYFRWVGPAAMKEFQWFAGLSLKPAKDAVASLGLVPIEPGSDRLLLPEDLTTFTMFEAPAEPRYTLVSSLDTISAARRNVQSLVDAKDRPRKIIEDAGEKQVGAISDLPSHAILDRGRLVGLWEYDMETDSIAWSTFGIKKNRALETKVEEMETFVRDDLGDARSFSLDSPKSRATRVAAIRKAGR